MKFAIETTERHMRSPKNEDAIVLLVEPDVSLMGYLIESLAMLGAQGVRAHTKQAAEEVLGQIPEIHVIISSYTLSDGNAFDLLWHARKSINPGMRAIVITQPTETQKATKVRGEARDVEILEMPFKRTDLLSHLSRMGVSPGEVAAT